MKIARFMENDLYVPDSIIRDAIWSGDFISRDIDNILASTEDNDLHISFKKRAYRLTLSLFIVWGTRGENIFFRDRIK